MLTARCYCGASRWTHDGPPLLVAYCHCGDCRRWTGAPVAAFAAFENTGLHIPGTRHSHTQGVERWNCSACGSPLAARFDYLPGQTYVPVGVLDQAETLQPVLHSHADRALPWLHIDDDLPRAEASARDMLDPAR
ncbi:GFA family protein [uncultured Tateyamaria sp.]|uniref:GFA family protein n=1 Tax=uncultured Tateyamaria sp. TaxID=455651 RepID=UPI002601773F|nr:GFA family protein [uncultured Tateyamaria sp.]